MFRVNLPPKPDGTPNLILPDVHETEAEALAFFQQTYKEDGFDWFWLETVHRATISDLIQPSMIPGLIKEGLAEHGIDDSVFNDRQYAALNDIACMAMDDALAKGGITIPTYIVETTRRVNVDE